MSEIQMIRNNEFNITMSNISKDNNRIEMQDNSIQEKMNKFWNYYSKILMRFSWLILVLSLCITIGLTICCFLFMEIRQFDETNFFIQNGQALKNIQRIRTIFGNDKNFRAHQQMSLYPAIDIIIKRKLQTNNENVNETNMLNNEIIDEV
ncbi:unnamed protein product [Rotaria sp. Silwood2]|nr:unnamed protein product [Rotaria sp. Silwood2]CAF4681531.1 unnamed protein product [Rotaria sp. Silwood2]